MKMYNPIAPRFWTPDRFAEKYPWLSPYSYAANNPIRYIDVNGDSIDIFDNHGALLMTVDDGKDGYTGLYFQKSKTDKNGNRIYSSGISFGYNDESNPNYEHKILDSSKDQRAIRNGFYFNKNLKKVELLHQSFQFISS